VPADRQTANRRPMTNLLGTSPGTVYLLCFDQPIGNPDNPRARARHYIGWAADVQARITTHTLGNCNSAKIIRHLKQLGIGFTVARTWPGDRLLEKAMKARKCAPRLCPLCSPQRVNRGGQS
jgi:hypothetical protein